MSSRQEHTAGDIALGEHPASVRYSFKGASYSKSARMSQARATQHTVLREHPECVQANGVVNAIRSTPSNQNSNVYAIDFAFLHATQTLLLTLFCSHNDSAQLLLFLVESSWFRALFSTFFSTAAMADHFLFFYIDLHHRKQSTGGEFHLHGPSLAPTINASSTPGYGGASYHTHTYHSAR